MALHMAASPHRAPACAIRTRRQRRCECSASAAGGALLRLEPNLAPVGLGTWQWGNALVYGYSTERDEELQAAFEALVSSKALSGRRLFFDSGDSYGKDGRAETLLGRFARSSAHGRNAVLATKLAPFPTRFTAESFVQAARDSAERLQTPVVDVLQAHWPPPAYLPWQEGALTRGLAQAADAGLGRAIGVSNYGPASLRRVHRRLRELGHALVSVQVQYSLLSRLPERSGLLEVARELDVTVIGYSPLALGLLSGAYLDGASPPGLLRQLLFPVQLKDAPLTTLLSLLSDIARERGVSTASVAINWSRGHGTLPIAGVRSAAQARGVLEALSFELSEGEVRTLDDVSARCKQVTQNSFQNA